MTEIAPANSAALSALSSKTTSFATPVRLFKAVSVQEATNERKQMTIEEWDDEELGKVIALVYNTQIQGDIYEAPDKPCHVVVHGPRSKWSTNDCLKITDGASFLTPKGESIEFPSIIQDNEFLAQALDKLLILPPEHAGTLGANGGASLQALSIELDPNVPTTTEAQKSWDSIKDEIVHLQAVTISGMLRAGHTQGEIVEEDSDAGGLSTLQPMTAVWWLTTTDPWEGVPDTEEHGPHQRVIRDRFVGRTGDDVMET